jgi:hypothetical protein
MGCCITFEEMAKAELQRDFPAFGKKRGYCLFWAHNMELRSFAYSSACRMK